MEIKNNLENKAKFFAQYWGQKVMRCKTFNETTGQGLSGLMNVDVNSETIKENWFLELTPLSQISDEELDTIVRLIGEIRNNPFSEIGRRNTRSYLNNRMMPSIEFRSSTQVGDFLRSRGYALPWMGISVDTLVEWGWVQLKGGEND